MQSPETQKAKKSLRITLTAARVELAKNPEVSSMLATRLKQLTMDLQATTVAAYLPFGTEPDIGEFLASASTNGIKLLMPVSEKSGQLSWVEYTGESAPGIFGFLEPIGKPAKLADAQLILVPASAADATGNRLGKGKGFYDKALGALATEIPVAAVIYQAELISSVPVEPHDQKVDIVVTPERTVWVSKSSMS